MKNKIVYWISTGLLSLLLLLSAFMYFFNNQEVSNTFLGLGFPSYLVYPLAIAKLLALVAIWSRLSNLLIVWAYVGIFFNTILALFSHIMAKDGEYQAALIAVILVIISYYFYNKTFGNLLNKKR